MSWEAKPNKMLEERQAQLWDRYHAINDIIATATKQLESVKTEQHNAFHDNKVDKLNQLNAEYKTPLMLGVTYLITNDLLSKYEEGGFVGTQPAICTGVAFFSYVQFKGKHGIWTSINASMLKQVQIIECDFELLVSTHKYKKYPCHKCNKMINLDDMGVYNGQLQCIECEASQDD